MKAIHLPIAPTPEALAAGRTPLTPELLAAVLARHSRSPDGIESILGQVDLDDPQASIDRIFKFVDYGHASIAGMVPVALSLEGLSLFQIYRIFAESPCADGQETSTRYCRFDQGGLPDPDALGIPGKYQDAWYSLMIEAFDRYHEAYAFWLKMAERHPELTRIPQSLRDSDLSKDQKAVARMQNNYAFDRARYWLPVACQNNMGQVQSAREWVLLCQKLFSSELPEAQQVARLIREELQLVAPSLIKHAKATLGWQNGLLSEFQHVVKQVRHERLPGNLGWESNGNQPNKYALFINSATTYVSSNFRDDLIHHENRYGWFGPDLRRASVKLRIDGLAIAELRDLNRHRPGCKYTPLIPKGFYCAADQLPQGYYPEYAEWTDTGRKASASAYQLLEEGDPSYVYWMLLGTQVDYEHVLPADRFLYAMELRTGVGSHFAYAKHCRELLQLWYGSYPETKGWVLEGSAEPE